MMRPWRAMVACVCALAMARMINGEPLGIDVSHPMMDRAAVDLGQGTFTDPSGHTLGADSRCFLMDGKPWVPVAGEFHYTRYPRAEWRDELLKMKAGGISVVSTYVFWIFHEEEKGQFNWTDQRSLREFLQLVKNVGLKAIVRMGPWDHGEVVNGGLPEWVQNAGGGGGVKLRSLDPAFMAMVKPLYQEIAGQMKGLLWKDGGPVIGIQVDNECSNLPYLLALKEMAKACGVDVPFYTMTGWNGARIPTKDLLPLFGAYSEGFWGGTIEKYRKSFEFTEVRDDGDLGAQIVNTHPDRSNNIERFPYACCEIGGGMMSSDARRIKIVPADIAAMALVKLGSGNNMPGYYMYHGGMNPEGKLAHLEEDHPNGMPVKDYDFQAPLGACGEEREQYGLLREQHLFLEDFGEKLALMPAIFPEVRPKDLKDFSTVRWSVRSDGESGFLFFNNEQPLVALPAHKEVQFSVKMKGGMVTMPREAVTIPPGSFGIWPVNMDCDGVKLRYATAQPLCRMREGNDAWYFFAAIDGIAPEFSFEPSPRQVDRADMIKNIVAGSSVTIIKDDKSTVTFVVLTRQQAMHLSRQEFAGRQRLVESEATVFADGGELRMQSTDPTLLTASVFPPVGGMADQKSDIDGVFRHYEPKAGNNASPIPVEAEMVSPAGVIAGDGRADKEESWDHAQTWALHIPAAASGRHLILQIHYVGDALRIYDGDKFVDDNFYNGDDFDLALWRIPAKDWGALTVKILPLTEALLPRLPERVRRRFEGDAGSPMNSDVKVKAVEVREVRIAAK